MNSPHQDIADNVAALTRPATTTTTVQRNPGPGADGIRRRTAEILTYRVEHPSLLQQLTAALQRGRSAPDDGGGGGRPGSRPPSAGPASAALQVIGEEARWLHRDLLHASGRSARRLASLAELLEDIRGQAHGADDDLVRRTAALTAAMVTTARDALTLDAPVATLRDVRCPHCQTPLKVRQDGSSDVWCPDVGCRDVEGRRYRWARPEWPFLLERIAGGSPVEEGVA